MIGFPHPAFWQLVDAGLAVVAAVVVARVMPMAVDAVIRRGHAATVVDRFFEHVLRIAILLVGISVAFGFVGVNIAAIIGAGTVILALAGGIQGIAKQMFEGVVLLTERRFEVGDVITVGAVSGTLTDLGIRAATLRGVDGEQITVPNDTLFSSPVIRRTAAR